MTILVNKNCHSWPFESVECRLTANTKHFITFVQRRLIVFDVVPTFYKCYTNVLCFLGAYIGDISGDTIRYIGHP